MAKIRKTDPCKKVVLAGAEGCRVVFCEECKVAELEVGSLSLRLEADAFCTLAEILQQAALKMALFNQPYQATVLRHGNVH